MEILMKILEEDLIEIKKQYKYAKKDAVEGCKMATEEMEYLKGRNYQCLKIKKILEAK